MIDRRQFADSYTNIEKLSEGGGGIVYKAYHKRLQKEVVLKKMRTRSVSALVNRQEVDMLKNLNHSFLPQVLDFLDDGQDIYTVMSYIPGKSFQQLINQGYRFQQSQLIQWGMQLCSALNYLHSQKPPIIHGDIKPANIMLTPQGNICLIDFNIAFFLDGNTVLGYTNGYSSPEQYIIVMDSKKETAIPNYTQVDEKSDIYSLGATFYHLITGKKKDDYRTPLDMKRLSARTSPALAQVIEKAMRYKATERYQSAFQMFKAFQAIPSKDSRYRALVRRQKMTRAGLVLALAGFIVLGGYGIHEMRLEQVERYNKLVSEQTSSIDAADYEMAEKRFEEAKALLPSALETYYQEAYALYEQRDYDECIAFIDYDILGNEKLDPVQERMADVYYLLADSYFQTGAYGDAEDAYENVFQLGGRDPVYYRDYAITLTYGGEPERALEVLEEAEECGLEEDSIYYARGEIEKSMGQNEAALEAFHNCIAVSEDVELKSRAYLLCSELYTDMEDMDSARKILLEAEEKLPIETQILLVERLIQTDLFIYEKSGDPGILQETIDELNKVIEQNWATYQTYDNLTILYEKQKNIEAAESCLQTMKELFGEDYNIYKRYAFLEIDRQERLDNQSREYRKFAEYYEKAKELYETQLEGNNTDAEMGLLDNLYLQVKAGDWLK